MGEPQTVEAAKEEHVAEAHAVEASRRPSKGSFQKPNPKWHKRQTSGENDRPRTYPHRRDNNKLTTGNCPKCRKKGHYTKDCRAFQYLVNMYQKLKQLRNTPITIVLPGGFPLNCEKTMHALDAPRCLISYRDLRARNIHICITMHGSEEIIELRQGPKIVATANTGPDGLYKVAIKPLAANASIAEEEVCMAAWYTTGYESRQA